MAPLPRPRAFPRGCVVRRDGCADAVQVGGQGALDADVKATDPRGRRWVIQCEHREHRRHGPSGCTRGHTGMQPCRSLPRHRGRRGRLAPLVRAPATARENRTPGSAEGEWRRYAPGLAGTLSLRRFRSPRMTGRPVGTMSGTSASARVQESGAGHGSRTGRAARGERHESSGPGSCPCQPSACRAVEGRDRPQDAVGADPAVLTCSRRAACAAFGAPTRPP